MKKILFISLLFTMAALGSFAQNRLANEQPPHLIRFYPNPATAIINFDYQKGFDAAYSLTIYNFMGKKVYEMKNTPSRFNVNLEDFFRGIYIFQLRNKNGQIIESGKFQVVK